MDFLDIVCVTTVAESKAAQFSSEHPEHTEDVNTFVLKLRRITSELQSAVYARQKSTRTSLRTN
jgi:hypothetical protein